MKQILGIAAAACLVGGCAQHRVVVPHPDFAGQPVTADSNAIGWVAKQRRTVADCPTNSLHEVRVHQSFLQGLATVLTLGLWMPTKLEYRCGKQDTEEGSTGGAGQ